MSASHRIVSSRFWNHAARRAAPRTLARRRPCAQLETLERRDLMTVGIRALDGSNNNLAHPDWGAVGADLLRVAPAEYADGRAAPAGADRPSARAVSNALVEQDGDVLNDRDLSAMVYAWGQFLDHDLDLTPAGSPAVAFNVAVPKGDPEFDPTGTGTKTIGLTRSLFDSATGTSAANPRQQINTLTAFIDGSQIYGVDAARAKDLRTLSGGQLKTSEGNMLPYNSGNWPNDNATGLPYDSLYMAGDVRANENIELSSMQTLFVREHNRLATRYAAANPSWSDEQVFQAARRIVIGELQTITYNEFLPALLGDNALSRYRGYNPNVNPGITNEFSTAGFRVGHSMLGADVEFLDNRGIEVRDEVELRDAFFNPELLGETGIDGVLKYLASDPAQEIDSTIVDDVRNFLFGPPGAGGFDLASLNIQRGRDHGLADYNATRVAYGLPAVTSFAQITSDVAKQQVLAKTYGNVNNVDLWVGGLAEDHARGGSMGPLFKAILVDQFQRLRDGDRFWYQRDLNRSELSQVESTSLADVIRRNTTTVNLQDNVFRFHTEISGRVIADTNRDGRIGGRDQGLRGITVELVDLNGNLMASTVTGRDGSYTFDNVEFGTFRVRLALPGNVQQITRDPRAIDITRSQNVGGVNFGVKLLSLQLPATAAQSAAATDEVLASLDASLPAA